MIKTLFYNIQDVINNILINKLHKPYILHNEHIFKINHISISLIDCTTDDDTYLNKASIQTRTYVTNIFNKKDYVIPMNILSEEEANKCNIETHINTLTIPVSFKL